MKRSTLILGLSALLLTLPTLPARAGGAAPLTKQDQAAVTPERALQWLKEGNTRFAAGTTLRRDLGEQVDITSQGQYPYAAILGCIDSRVSPELVFDTGLGDIFAARVAGNVVDEALLGSLEFATQVAGARAIVVLGHSECGAVKGACDGVKLGHLTTTLSLITPAVTAVKDVAGERNSKNHAFVEAVAEANVRLTARRLTEQSPILADLVKAGRLSVQPALYDLATGRVTFLD